MNSNADAVARENKMTATPQTPPKIFISYAHLDHTHKDDLIKHLKPRLRGGLLTEWDDKQIKPGSQWHQEIQNALAEADMGVLLVSANFLASDYIHENEFNALLAKKNLIWIAVSASGYKHTPLKDLQCANDPAKPLDAITKAKRAAAWEAIWDKILEASGDF